MKRAKQDRFSSPDKDRIPKLLRKLENFTENQNNAYN